MKIANNQPPNAQSTTPTYGSHLANSMIDVTPKGRFIAITDKNSTDSPLLRLPAELRNYIWQYVIGGQTIRPRLQDTIDMSTEEQKKLASDSWRPSKHRFSLLRVCRQIYAETATLPYALSTFSFVGLRDMNTWFNGLPSWQVKAIDHIRNIGISVKPVLHEDWSPLMPHFSYLERVHLTLWCFDDEASRAANGRWAAVIAEIFRRRFSVSYSYSEKLDWLGEWLEERNH